MRAAAVVAALASSASAWDNGAALTPPMGAPAAARAARRAGLQRTPRGT
jgi:hypothetical protein